MNGEGIQAKERGGIQGGLPPVGSRGHSQWVQLWLLGKMTSLLLVSYTNKKAMPFPLGKDSKRSHVCRKAISQTLVTCPETEPSPSPEPAADGRRVSTGSYIIDRGPPSAQYKRVSGSSLMNRGLYLAKGAAFPQGNALGIQPENTKLSDRPPPVT